MSGGSYGYIYSRLIEECDGAMYDAEMNAMIKDLAEVLHDLEWWRSGDSSEEQYRTTLARFKTMWFTGDRSDRLKGYIGGDWRMMNRDVFRDAGKTVINGMGGDAE